MSNSSRERVLKVYPRAWESSSGSIWQHSPEDKAVEQEHRLGSDWDGAASRLSSPAGETPSEPKRKVLTAADIQKLDAGNHKCGWTIGPVKNPNPACGCMCGTVYAPDGRSILKHSGRHGMRCQHADERGLLIAVPEPVPTGGAADSCVICKEPRIPMCRCVRESRRPSAPEAAAAGESLEHHTARGIVGYMFEHFYPEVKTPNILPDLSGLLTQISNMTVGLQRKVAAPIAPAAVSETEWDPENVQLYGTEEDEPVKDDTGPFVLFEDYARLVNRLRAVSSQAASAEGDGWIAKVEKLLAISCCHITGMHDPNHVGKYVCRDQKAAAYDRIVESLNLNPDGLQNLATYHSEPECYWCKDRLPAPPVNEETE